MPTTSRIDIKENDIYDLSHDLLRMLLCDRTRCAATGRQQAGILWATDNYESLGAAYRAEAEITAEAITGSHGDIIQPRVVKSRAQQQQRVRDRAEVFTPSWICNKQNNLIDAAWFGRDGVFNVEIDRPDGTHTWQPTDGPIRFPAGRTWRDYVRENRLEITCGEAPYLVSRYDTVTGEAIVAYEDNLYIPREERERNLHQRIGLLDRKLRVVGENVAPAQRQQWLYWARIAVQSCYGYEWQGDNLLLARENILYTYIDYYRARFGDTDDKREKKNRTALLHTIAEKVSWNLWQMDGLRGVIPGSCHAAPAPDGNLLFDNEPRQTVPCPGCAFGDIHKHNGIYCLVRDWTRGETFQFKDMIR